MNRAKSHPTDHGRSRAGAWWVADEEPEILSADRSERPALPGAVRGGFISGSWDATGLLLDRYNEVEGVAAKLPYVSGWR